MINIPVLPRNKSPIELITSQMYSVDFLKNIAEFIDWKGVSKKAGIPFQDFIRDFADKVDWVSISQYQELSEDFIREFADKVNWMYISETQELSEDFIREFAGRVDWDAISRYQKLSLRFIREFKSEQVMCKNLQQCIMDGHAESTLALVLMPELSSLIAAFL